MMALDQSALLDTSGSHAGMRTAIAPVLPGVAWQPCRDCFPRNVPAQVPKGSAEIVAATIQTIFA
jgi:putative transposase